jgi:hypothetical protein
VKSLFIRPRQDKFKTTASEAERGALNRTVAKEVEQNAEQAQDVARQAALAAHVSVGLYMCFIVHTDSCIVVYGARNDW